MPSADNVSDLIVFSGIAIGIVIVTLVATYFLPAGRRLRERDRNWQFTPPSQTGVRQKYVDPLPKSSFKFAMIIFWVSVVVVFTYYFIARGGFAPGN